MHIKSYKQNRSIINGEIRMIEVEKMFDDFEFGMEVFPIN